jgi:hypothetical protein
MVEPGLWELLLGDPQLRDGDGKPVAVSQARRIGKRRGSRRLTPLW